MQKSEWDGLTLPSRWNHISSWSKGQIIGYLQGRIEDAPPCWWNMQAPDRQRVILHLCAVGSVDLNYRTRIGGGQDVPHAVRKARESMAPHCAPLGYRDGGYVHQAPVSFKVRQARDDNMFYPKPNGGKRILPSIYTKLRDRWLRGNGVYQDPHSMNQGHIRNTLALLKESHVNLIDRMIAVLGKMHVHLGNRPDIQRDIEALFHKLETVDVSELYPIFDRIASHIGPEISIGQDRSWLNDEDWLREY
jgi:hypothetical protein